MPTLESPSAEELERQSSELVTALNAAVMTTMTSAATELGVNAVSSSAVAATVPSLWLTYVEKTALTYILDAYLDAAGFVLETVDANRQRGFSLISDTVAQQFTDGVRKQFATLGDELAQLVSTAMRAMIRATLPTDTVTRDAIAHVIRTVALPASRVAFVAQSMIRAAVESGTLAQVLSLGEHLQVTRTWKSHHDDRTRPWHRVADGQVVGLHDAFHVGDSWLQAPSVPAVGRSFDVGDVCNCRCTVRYGLDIITNTTNARSAQETSMAVPQPNESALVAAAGKWNPSAHPRGKDGRFIKKGALSTLLSTQKPNIGHVLEGMLALDKAQWSNLTDAQKTYIKDSVEKLPKASQAYKSSKAVLDTLDNLTTSDIPTPASVTPTVSLMKAIPAHKGAPAGTPAKVSTALVWGKYDDGDVILESATGDKRVIWDGKAKKYATQDKLSDGTWQSTKFESKKDFYANSKGDNSYVVPGATAAVATAPTSEPAPSVVAPALAPAPALTIPEINVPTALHGENSEFTLSASIMGLPALTTMLSKVPPNTVIATYTPGIIDDDTKKRRIVSTSAGLLERQVLTSSGQWDKVSTVGPTSLAAEFVSNAKWKINQDLVPNVQKPSGDPVTDWSAHLQKNFVSGDIIATHESGLKRAVQTGTTGYGTTYDIQTFDQDSNTWNVQQYESMLNSKFFTSNAIHYSASGEWIAGVPSTPPVAIPKPNIPAPVTPNIPGGVPLQFNDENVINFWTGLLGNKDHTPGEVVALHNSGDYRVIAHGVDVDYGNKPTYTIEKWNSDSNKWVKEYPYKFAPYDTYDKVADVPGPWLAPLPNGAQYPPKGSVPSTPNVPSTVSTPNVSAPVVSPSFNPLGTGSDITGIPASVKTAMKATLKPGKIGYWSKPEKIWDSIKEIQSKYPDPANPGHSQYSATQVLKALDSTLKTNDPSPFETKITKWAASPKGQAYIKKSLHTTAPTAPTPTPTPTPVPTMPTSTPSMPSNISIGADDISHFTLDQKKDIFNAFKKQPNPYIGSPGLAIFTALKTVSQDHNISVMQALKIVDDYGALNAGVTNLNLFENKVKKWLTTKQGTLAVGGTVPLSSVLARKVDYSPGVSTDNIPTFDASSIYKYEIMSVAQAHTFDKDVLKMSELPSAQLSALKSYSGNAYSDVNAYLYGSTDTITPAKMNIAKNAQKAMRPSNIPMLLHRGVPYSGIADSIGFEDLQSKVGQTWMSGGFFSTSVGGKAAFSHNPVTLEVEVPPGTPMAWMEHLMGDGSYTKTLTSHPGEKEMLLAAGLSYRIISVTKDSYGKTAVRLRVVPPSEEVTV